MREKAARPRGAAPESPLTLLLVRAAETEFSRQGRLEGDVDIPLTDRGRRRCADLVPEGVEHVYTAGNRSARETAEIVAGNGSKKVKVLDSLHGISLGLWEGQLASELRFRHGKVFESWVRDPLSVTPPAGESMEDAYARTGSALKAITRKHRKGTVAVVAQGAVISLLYCRLKALPPGRVFDVDRSLGDVEPVCGNGGELK
jgi:probable phosphoglycerate mutase